jgi:hypothetical protein
MVLVHIEHADDFSSSVCVSRVYVVSTYARTKSGIGGRSFVLGSDDRADDEFLLHCSDHLREKPERHVAL